MTPSKASRFLTALESRRIVAVSLLVVGLLCTYKLFFGSADVEESANSLYSAGARSHLDGNFGIPTLTYSKLGVPVFDTHQATGNRLPYQASWAQSVSWPLRFMFSANDYSLIRSTFFLMPALYLWISTLLSWRPQIQKRLLVLFGLLCNSSFGLFLRQNEWSDHYVQVIGISAISFFFMRKEFHVLSQGFRISDNRTTILCLFIAANGVLTGHPGLWPVALFVLVSVLSVFLLAKPFRVALCRWVTMQVRAVLLLVATSVLTLLAVVQDLLAEMIKDESSVGRLSRTPGLFSEYAFGGLYGLSQGGSLPAVIKSALSSALATTCMPLFVMFDDSLPQMFRASNFREFPRVEFTGILIAFALAVSWKSFSRNPLRVLLVRLFVIQSLIWLTVVLSVLDLLPTALASSGAWMTSSVLLPLNVFISILLLFETTRKQWVSRGIASLNVVMAGYWCLIQFGFASFDSTLRLPERFDSRSKSVERLMESEWYQKFSSDRDRIVILASPSFYDSLHFVALGIPVVAPADPKIRNSSHLRSTFSYDFSINPPSFEALTQVEIMRTMEFLQVKTLLWGEASNPAAVGGPSPSVALRSVIEGTTRGIDIHIPGVSYETFARNAFTLRVIEKQEVLNYPVCPVLYSPCPVVMGSDTVTRSTAPQLRLCSDSCLWKVLTPSVDRSKLLVIPVTFDETLRVHDSGDIDLDTFNVGGFLGVGSENGIDEGVISVTLDPDIRMLSRVFVSYLNLGIFLVLLGAVLQPWVQSRRRRLRIE